MAREDQLEFLVRNHLPLVKRIANHLLARLPGSVELADLMQAGVIGLIEAARFHDPSSGASFETYATIRIRGAMLDDLRRMDWVPRSVHRLGRQALQATMQLEQELGREATQQEVAQRVGISLCEYQALLGDMARQAVISIELDHDGEDYVLEQADSHGDPKMVLFQQAFQGDVSQAIKSLPYRLQLILSLYYKEELGLKEIASILKVSVSRVSQLHGQAILALRGKLDAWRRQDIEP
jgi:RNA polymerase sigma factor for flagellar operon FliA